MLMLMNLEIFKHEEIFFWGGGGGGTQWTKITIL